MLTASLLLRFFFFKQLTNGLKDTKLVLGVRKMIAINEKIKVLPPEAMREVIDLVESLTLKYAAKKASAAQPKKEILNFAGAWKDMDERDYQSFTSEMLQRRQQPSTRRREF